MAVSDHVKQIMELRELLEEYLRRRAKPVNTNQRQIQKRMFCQHRLNIPTVNNKPMLASVKDQLGEEIANLSRKIQAPPKEPKSLQDVIDQQVKVLGGV